MKPRRILLLVGHVPKNKHESLNYGRFEQEAQSALGATAEVTVAALKEFRFEIGVGGTRVWIPSRNLDVYDFDLVIFRLWSNQSERAAAMAHYLRSLGIRFSDPSAGLVHTSKAASAMLRWTAGVSVPATIFGTRRLLSDYMRDPDPLLQFPCILKAVSGRKGRDNFMVRSKDELNRLLEREATGETEFILQQFISSDGDFRFLVLGRYVRLVMRRRAIGGSHLSNTSQGGVATLCTVKDFPAAVRRDVLRAASLDNVEMAGVDVIVDQNSGRHYILEVNRAPQLLTGAHTKEKMAAFARFLKNTAKQSGRPLRVIGRRAPVVLPEFGLNRLTGKVDTGAYRCSLHAEDIEVSEVDSQQVLHFTVKGLDLPPTRCVTADFKRVRVRSSNGLFEQRYLIKTTLIIAGQRYNTVLTLTDRQSMRYPLLLGRRLLRHNFIVDSALTEGVFEKV